MLITLSAQDLAHIRLLVSPWWETLAAVRTILHQPALHRAWAKRTLADMAEDRAGPGHWDVLRTFVVHDRMIAGVLTPTPSRDETFEESVERVLAQDDTVWFADLERARNRVERPQSQLVIERFEADLDAGRDEVAAAARWFWHLAVEPSWERIHALQLADIAHRSGLIARGGLEEVLQTLHPQVMRVPDGLELQGDCTSVGAGGRGPGLILLPCVFAWPGTFVLNRAPFTPTLTYSPRGAGALWDRPVDAHASPLNALLGGMRATILLHLDVPMTTTQLAVQLMTAAATVSDHLKVLAAADLLQSVRRGREVYYSRTARGDELCRA
ncbi:ArsR/SmtB family transcription factor [Microbacterium gorillae]|uniref:ArsR/SmtB family transcription factor n=1 Tax=Microbacterium gorillae TaxID=1231063 RepID=UPI0006949535|nr:DUF5937 family protein [Microbacterium gorillae]